jgi:hypothetical protein
MASRTTSLTFDLFAKDKTASATFDRFGRNVSQTDRKVSTLGSTFSKFGKMAAAGIAVGVTAAGVALTAFGESAIDQAREAQKATAQTAAVIKSTGGAAHVTAGQVSELANALSMKAGIDDETIQSGENVLLTFRNIRDEVGKGNDIFKQATAATLDMSVAMGKDLTSSSVLVGKALNDPITGLSALTRVGVQFTDQQKANITSLVEQGDTMKAQKIILGELNKEFAGSAAAQATAGEKAKVAWENFQEEIGNKLLPLLDKLAVFFVNTVIPALQKFSAWFSTEAIPVIKQFAADAAPIIKQAAAIIMAAIEKIVVFVKKNWPQIRDTIAAGMDLVLAVIRDTIAVVTFIWKKWGEDIFAVVKILFQLVVDEVRAGLKIMRGVMDLFTGLLTGDWSLAWQGVKEIFGGAWDAIVAILKAALHLVAELIRVAWDGVKDVTKRAWDGIKDVIKLAWKGISDLFRSFIAGVTDQFLGFIQFLLEGADKAFGWLPGIGGKLDAAVQDFARFREGVNAQIRGIDASKSIAIHIIPDNKFQQLITSGAGHPAWTGSGLAKGGPIFGRVKGRDSVPFMGMPGEHVWTTSEVDKAGGHGTMIALREMAESGALKTLLGMAGGGPVGGAQTGPVPQLANAGQALSSVGRMAAGVNNLLSQLVMLVKESSMLGVGAALKFAQRQEGKPYGWGKVGPASYDCSGLMSAITNVLRGLNPFSRVGTTATFPWAGFAPGPGVFMIGSTANAGGGIGHMAGTLGGVNVESAGGVGVRVGKGARGARDSMFTQLAHLTGLAKLGHSGGGDTGILDKFEKNIIRVESGGSVFANNPTSSAFGLGQLLEANRVAYARRLGYNAGVERGDTGTTNRDAQIAMMRAYIHDRYGTSKKAWDFWQGHNWYGKGLQGGVFTRPTVIGVGDRGPERVDVTPLRSGGGRRGGGGPVRVTLEIAGHQIEGVLRGIVREELEDEFAYQAGGV